MAYLLLCGLLLCQIVYASGLFGRDVFSDSDQVFHVDTSLLCSSVSQLLQPDHNATAASQPQNQRNSCSADHPVDYYRI
jgi:hypothetical protein